MPTENTIAAAFVAACADELAALKPGNVHRHADGHGMTVADFEISAQAAAKGIAGHGQRVGRRILDATEATWAATGKNTNLGIILLCAPLAAAAEKLAEAGAAFTALTLAAATRQVLADLDVDDARLAFRAIALAKPGGLGSVAEADVHTPPSCTLGAAMAMAAWRDRIAGEYAGGFASIFAFGLPLLQEQFAAASREHATTGLFLALLAQAPDSHLLRKFGDSVAHSVTVEAQQFLSRFLADGPARLHAELLAWDSRLKACGWNPGTSADLTVATLFVHRLTRPGARQDRFVGQGAVE